MPRRWVPLASAVAVALAAFLLGRALLRHRTAAAGMAEAREALGRLDARQASAAVRVVLAIRPDDPAAWRVLGAAESLARAPRAARAAYERALALAPGDAAAVAGLERLAAQLGDAAGAERRLREALARDPAALPIRRELGLLVYARGDPRAALDLLLRVWDAVPDDAEVASVIARIRREGFGTPSRESARRVRPRTPPRDPGQQGS